MEKGSLMAYNDLQIFDGQFPLIRENTEVARSELPAAPIDENSAATEATIPNDDASPKEDESLPAGDED